MNKQGLTAVAVVIVLSSLMIGNIMAIFEGGLWQISGYISVAVILYIVYKGGSNE